MQIFSMNSTSLELRRSDCREVVVKQSGTNKYRTAYVYNNRGETNSITHYKSGDLYKLEYIRDGASNPLQIAFSGSEFDEPYTSANKVRYEYDTIDRLTKEDWGYGSWTSVNSTTWAYDWVGNRNPSTYSYNQVDELEAGNGYVYDMLGNLEYKPSSSAYPRTRYYYNADNLLNKVDDVVDAETTNTTNITWDADQQRLKLERGSDTWEMIYDPTADVPAVLLAKNYVSSNTSYMYNVRELGGELLASFDAAGTPNIYYYHLDNLGSSVLVTNGSGTVSDSFTYGAWGAVLNTPANNQKPYQYVGILGYYKHNSAQGTALEDLMQLGVRSYDPQTGRFTQRDPIKNGIDLYVYGGNAPLQNADPSGLCFEDTGTEGLLKKAPSGSALKAIFKLPS